MIANEYLKNLDTAFFSGRAYQRCKMKKILTGLTVIFALIIFVPGVCFSIESGPDFVDDQTQILTKHERERIVQMNGKLLKDLDIHIKVVVLEKSPLDINQEAVRLFEEAALGKKTQEAKGVLFLVDPTGKQVRLEIGYDLEPVFTDGFTGYIERKQMVPFFQADKAGPGIEATVELLVKRAFGAIEPSKYVLREEMSETGNHYSGGGGALTQVEIGSSALEKKTTSRAHEFGPQSSPQKALEKYIEILALHIKDPNLGIYTPETREFFNNWIITDAQQDNSLRHLEKTINQAVVLRGGNLVVIRFPITNRNASPYFLRRTGEGWMLDFSSMNRIIGFNHKNQWFFRTKDHSFMFGFKDVIFDKNGFPHIKK